MARHKVSYAAEYGTRVTVPAPVTQDPDILVPEPGRQCGPGVGRGVADHCARRKIKRQVLSGLKKHSGCRLAAAAKPKGGDCTQRMMGANVDCVQARREFCELLKKMRVDSK